MSICSTPTAAIRRNSTRIFCVLWNELRLKSNLWLRFSRSLFFFTGANFLNRFLQVTSLVVFDKILSDSDIQSDPKFAKLIAFSKTVARAFFEKLASNRFAHVVRFFF